MLAQGGLLLLTCACGKDNPAAPPRVHRFTNPDHTRSSRLVNPFVVASRACVSELQVPLPGAMPCEKGPSPPLPPGEGGGEGKKVEGTAGEVSLRDRAAHLDVPFDLTR